MRAATYEDMGMDEYPAREEFAWMFMAGVVIWFFATLILMSVH